MDNEDARQGPKSETSKPPDGFSRPPHSVVGEIPEPVAEPVMPELRKKLWILGFRRQFLINRRRQLRTIVMIVVPYFALLIVTNVLLHETRAAQTDTIFLLSPEAGQMLRESDRRELVTTVLISSFIVYGVLLIALIETHRTEGAAFNIRRQLHRIGNGNLDVELRLRKHDNLRELIAPFNRAVRSIRYILMRDTNEIEEIAREVEGLDHGEELAEKLRLIVSKRRDMIRSD